MKKDDWIMFLILVLGASLIAFASVAFFSLTLGEKAVKYE